MRYCIELSYNGTNFAGWQSQPNAISVQEVIEKALSTLLRTQVAITGSSRTDAGVHALQQFAHFDFETSVDVLNLTYKINHLLPFSIFIKRIFLVDDQFHARFDAKARAYEYRISKNKNPFLHNLAYQFGNELNIEMMNEACLLLFKYNDFQCFSKVHTDVLTFNCNIITANWTLNEGLLTFHIKANRFLRGMVRAIVGTLIEIGLGKITLVDFEAIILSKSRQKAGTSVPACGLFLTEVEY